MKHVFASIVLCLITTYSYAQQITAKIIDNTTKNPIPYATIKTGTYSGIISNEDGYFTLNNNNTTSSVTISCLGYESVTLTVQDIINNNNTIALHQAINQLNEIYISNKNPNPDSIIANIKRHINSNYSNKLNKHSIFHRTTNYTNFENLDFEIDKASHFKKKNLELANQNLSALSKKFKESNLKQFIDFKGELYTLNKDSSRITVSKATKLLDHKNDFSIDDVEEKAKHIILTYLDTTKTYKLKSGIFKIEDSLSLNDEEFKDIEKDSFKTKSLNYSAKSELRRAQFFENSFLNKLLDTDLYEYTFEDFTYYNNNLTYVLQFTPKKGKAKYTGKLFVNDSDYAITKVDYKYYKNRHGQKLNLKLILGVKFIENTSEGTILFEKTSTNYQPKYVKHNSGSYFYVSRGLKFIENSSAKNKVNFDFKVEGYFSEKRELLFTQNDSITLSDFEAINQKESIPFKKLTAFDKSLWGNEASLEPTEEMKAFNGD